MGFLEFLSATFGWIYTLSWSLSFYSQPLLNIRRKSTSGTTVDYPFINTFGTSLRRIASITHHTLPPPSILSMVFLTYSRLSRIPYLQSGILLIASNPPPICSSQPWPHADRRNQRHCLRRARFYRQRRPNHTVLPALALGLRPGPRNATIALHPRRRKRVLRRRRHHHRSRRIRASGRRPEDDVGMA